MKLYKILLFAFSFLLMLSAKAGTPVASIVFTNPATNNNLTHTFSSSSSSENYSFQTTKGNLTCRQIPAGKYGYFNVNDATIPSTQNNVIVNIT